MAGGGEGNLGWFRPLALHVANSIFVDGYLTTPGQAYREAQTMVTEMGFEIERAPLAGQPVRRCERTGHGLTAHGLTSSR